MRSHHILASLAIFFVIAGLNGCRQNEEISANDFLGTWMNTATRGNNWKSITLNGDGTAKLVYWNNNPAGPCRWRIAEDRLIVIENLDKTLVDLKYKLKNEKTLVLTGTPENLVLTGDGTYIRQ